MAEIERVVLTPAEAAAMLGISERSLRTLKRRGLIAWVPFGRGGVGYRPEDVLACRDAAVRREGVPTQKRSPKQIEPTRPAWLQTAIDEGRINKLTGERYGSQAS